MNGLLGSYLGRWFVYVYNAKLLIFFKVIKGKSGDVPPKWRMWCGSVSIALTEMVIVKIGSNLERLIWNSSITVWWPLRRKHWFVWSWFDVFSYEQTLLYMFKIIRSFVCIFFFFFFVKPLPSLINSFPFSMLDAGVEATKPSWAARPLCCRF